MLPETIMAANRQVRTIQHAKRASSNKVRAVQETNAKDKATISHMPVYMVQLIRCCLSKNENFNKHWWHLLKIDDNHSISIVLHKYHVSVKITMAAQKKDHPYASHGAPVQMKLQYKWNKLITKPHSNQHAGEERVAIHTWTTYPWRCYI